MDTESATLTPEAVLAQPRRPGTTPPSGSWVMFQHWRYNLFLHWPVPVEFVRPYVDPRLCIDTFDGSAWLTIVAMEMEHLHLRDVPPIPFVNTFPELNFRTYVTCKGQPGVYFFSIDADTRLGAWAASHFFHMPFVDATMEFIKSNGTYRLKSRRPASAEHRAAEFEVTYRPVGAPFRPEAGTREYFLAERYDSYGPGPAGALYRDTVHHAPWLLQPVDTHIARDTMFAAMGMPAPDALPLAIYSAGTRSLCWLPGKVDTD